MDVKYLTDYLGSLTSGNAPTGEGGGLLEPGFWHGSGLAWWDGGQNMIDKEVLRQLKVCLAKISEHDGLPMEGVEEEERVGRRGGKRRKAQDCRHIHKPTYLPRQ